ncbi:MAG: hypothetical protein DRP64_03765 [Verrucomicrobia bacterium]|nr:MAG: hypothetical protein DRP64_03765 [Verrucomicrobiota bacterium]
MIPVFEAERHPRCGSPYPLAYSRDKRGIPQEGGLVRFGWDETGLYVYADLEDSHIIVQNRQDEQLHYEHGDVFELFVKPRTEPYYWEMYAVPSGNKSTLFFPRNRAGKGLNDFLHGHGFQSLKVSVKQSSKGWNAQMFVPAAQLTALGAGWGDGTEWTVFCGRYNYNSEDLADPELSMAPPLSATNYHLTDEYARLRLLGE